MGRRQFYFILELIIFYNFSILYHRHVEKSDWAASSTITTAIS